MRKAETINTKPAIFSLILGIMIIWALPGAVLAQAPEITCPTEPIILSAEDVGQVCIELPIINADTVIAGDASWANDTLCFTSSVPYDDTILVTAIDTVSNDTVSCEIFIESEGTIKSGTIDGETWTSAESPYCIVSDINVGALNINPGVKVILFGNFAINVVGGYINATGNEQDSIIFVNASNIGSWGGLLFDQNALTTDLKYCRIEGSSNSAIRINNSDIVIQNCTITRNSSTYGGGIRVTDNTSFRIDDCIISENTVHGAGGGGIYVNGGISIISNCHIFNNSISNSSSTNSNAYGGGLYVVGEVFLNNCAIIGNNASTQRHNSDAYCRGGGIYINGQMTSANCNIRDNSTYAYADGYPSPYTHRYAYSYGGGIYSNGILNIFNCIVENCSSTVSCPGGHGHPYRSGSGICVQSGETQIINCAIVNNLYQGVRREGGTVNISNSILWGNGSGQISGSVAVTYSDIEGGFAGDGNIDRGPGFYNDYDSLTLKSTSPCIDSGNPLILYNDVEDPDNLGYAQWPARGTIRNDMGAYGGPGACGWLGLPIMYCPGMVDTAICALNEEVCIDLEIINADYVLVDDAYWDNNQLCFTPTIPGEYIFDITAGNDSGEVSCQVTVHIAKETPIELSAAELEFITTDTSTTGPEPQTINVNSTCDPGELDWQLTVTSDGGWLEVDKTFGTNPEDVIVSVADSALPLMQGAYTGKLIFYSDFDPNSPVIVEVSLFVEAGVDVGSYVTTPGTSFSVPIRLLNNEPISGFTIPLKFGTYQPDKVRLDSVVVNEQLVDSLFYVDDSTIIAYRPIQDPPLPDSLGFQEIGWMYYTVDTGAGNEEFDIYTTTVNYNSTEYSYQFVDTNGVPFVPGFDEGTITIGDPEPLIITDGSVPQGIPAPIPVIANGFSNVAGVEFEIQYDANIIDPDGSIVTSNYMSDMTISVVGDKINIIWEDITPIYVPDGDTLMTLWFRGVGDVGRVGTIKWSNNNHLYNPDADEIFGFAYHDGSAGVVGYGPDISGRIVYYDMVKPVPGVHMDLADQVTRIDSTNAAGRYIFADLPAEEYIVTPSCGADDIGVSVADCIKIRRHLAHLEQFDSPYKYKAADVNESGGISVADIVKIRRYLAHLEGLQCGNWAFIDSTFAVDTTNWYTAPTFRTVELLDQDISDINFVGIRMGDVNITYSPPGSIPAKMFASSEKQLSLDIQTVACEDNSNISIPINLTTTDPVAGMEMHLEYDSKQLIYSGVNSNLPGEVTVNGTENEIHIIWEDIVNVIESSDGETVVNLDFKSRENADGDASVTVMEAGLFNPVGDQYQIVTTNGGVTFSGKETTLKPDEYSLRQNYPNPFNPTTTIELNLPVASQYELEIYNIAGRLVRHYSGRSEPGVVRIDWDGCDSHGNMAATGIYLYRAKAGNFSATKKMLLLK